MRRFLRSSDRVQLLMRWHRCIGPLAHDVREAEVSRIGPSVRLLAALALAVLVVACDVVEGRQDVGEYFDDSSISNEIRGKFINDPVVHFGDIGVTTTNGVVHLSGRVNSPTERNRAAMLARSVRGVRAVDNGILVR